MRLLKRLITSACILCVLFQLLEVQQQLAVAVNTDRKKDAMIEQLDKVSTSVAIRYLGQG